MTPTIHLNTNEFLRATKEYMSYFRIDVADMNNQNAHDVLDNAATYWSRYKGGYDARRAAVRAYMWQVLAYNIRMKRTDEGNRIGLRASGAIKIGKTVVNKRTGESEIKFQTPRVRPSRVKDLGKFRHYGRTRRTSNGYGQQLHRANLIVQARQRAQGKPGLWGKKMAKAAGKLAGGAARSVGSVVIPILMSLDGFRNVAKYKRRGGYAILSKGISRWGQSRSFGGSQVARGSSTQSTATATMEWNIRASILRDNSGWARQMIISVFNAALAERAGKLLRAVEREFQRRANRYNARKAELSSFGV
jgi:hypothetical protein